MSSASGLLGPISEQPHKSVEMIASDALVIRSIFAPITAHPGTPRVVFVTCITTETPPNQQAALLATALTQIAVYAPGTR
jgi:hypothetical protein